MKVYPKEFREAYEANPGGPFFTSDFHFEHKHIVQYSGRPWTQDQNTEKLILRWNERVGIMDDVYHLGDFTFLYPKQIGQLYEIIGELNGNIHFVLGNHCDRRMWQMVEDRNFPQVAWIKDYHEMKVQGQDIILSHYPMEVWNGSHHGSWMLHGHCHGSLEPRGKRLDVGIDNHPEFRVFSYAEVALHMARQKFIVRDHHDGGR